MLKSEKLRRKRNVIVRKKKRQGVEQDEVNAPHNVELLVDMKGYGWQANKGRWCQKSKKLRRKRNVIGRKKSND